MFILDLALFLNEHDHEHGFYVLTRSLHRGLYRSAREHRCHVSFIIGAGVKVVIRVHSFGCFHRRGGYVLSIEGFALQFDLAGH